MPVRCTKSGCKYGSTGKLYSGKDAYKKAVKQAQAIKASQARQKKK